MYRTYVYIYVYNCNASEENMERKCMKRHNIKAISWFASKFCLLFVPLGICLIPNFLDVLTSNYVCHLSQ